MLHLPGLTILWFGLGITDFALFDGYNFWDNRELEMTIQGQGRGYN
jgi:hypothetical protein